MFIGLGATDIWNPNGDTLSAYVDDVSLVPKAPEPTSMVLMGIGMLGLFFARRNSRTSQ
jgi:hypothetical protein